MTITGEENMKIRIPKSTAILTGLMVFLLILMLSALVYIRILAGSPISERKPAGNSLEGAAGKTVTIPLNDSTRELDFQGIWECRITESSDPQLKITLPASVDARNISWKKKGTSLILENYSKYDRSGGEGVIAQIEMPQLESLSSDALIDLRFSGFTGKHLKIISNGIAAINGRNNRYESIEIIMSGAGLIDLTETQSNNAHVILNGAGSIELNMAGGVLDGMLSGLGNIEYRGEISKNSIQTTGLGRVGRAD